VFDRITHEYLKKVRPDVGRTGAKLGRMRQWEEQNILAEKYLEGCGVSLIIDNRVGNEEIINY